MSELNAKGVAILMQDGHRNSAIYRGVLEVLARFGYCSSQEIMFGFGLNYKKTENRLAYLNSLGLVKKFASKTVPPSFYCLTESGRQAVKTFGVSEYVSNFVPSDYRLIYQDHHRKIVKVYLVLRQMLVGA